MSARNRLAVALGVVLLAAGCGSHRHKAAEPVPPTSTTLARKAVRPPTSTLPASTAAPVPTTVAPLPTITLPLPYTSAQLERALLQHGDLPLESTRTVVAPNAWAGVCGSTPPAPPFSAAAVDFTGRHGLHVREDLADYAGSADTYLDVVRLKIACAAYTPEGQTGGPIKVVPIPAYVFARGLDTRNGATGVGVKTIDRAGNASFHVWVRQGDLVISLRDDARTATAVQAVQLTQLALERMKDTLA
jgi:hypothetical protein